MKKACVTIVLIAAIALVAVAAIAYLRLPILTASRTLPLSVSITGLDNGGAYPISSGLSVRAQAIDGVPIDRMEFWADGKLIDTQKTPLAGVFVFGHTWIWSPTTLGDHTLIVRAFDAQGRTSPSSVLHLRGTPDPGVVAIVTATGKDTLDSLARDYKTTVDAILAANPGLDAKSSLSGDVFVPIPPPAPAGTSSIEPGDRLASSSSPASQPASGLSFSNWFRMALVAPIAGLFAPTAPQLSAVAASCQAQLTIEDLSINEQGFYVYRLDPQTNVFSRIATLPSHSGSGQVSFTDGNLFGTFQYYVSAYDNSGEGVSNYVQVDVQGDACSQLANVFALTSLVKFDPSQVDRTYLYISVDQGNWTRVPQPPQTFMPPDTILNLGAAASMAATKPASAYSVRGELWGWSGGALVFLGSFDKSVTPPTAPPPVALELSLVTSLHVATPNPVVDATPHTIYVDQKGITTLGTEGFEWSTDSQGANGGRWQISTLPFSGDLDLNPPGLVLTGDAPAANGQFVKFPIDLSSLDPNKPQTVSAANQGGQLIALSTLPPFGPPLDPFKAQADPLAQLNQLLGLPTPKQYAVRQPGIPGGSGPQGMATANPGALQASDLYIRYNVRVIPMNGDQPVGASSNTVFLDYFFNTKQIVITTPPPPVKPYLLTITDVLPPHFPLAGYEYCIKITYNPYYADPNKFLSQNPFAGLTYGLYQPGHVYCPQKMSGHDKSWLDVLKEGFAQLLNEVSSLYNKLSDFVVDLAAKLNPVCIQAKFVADAANKGTQTIDDICHAVAKVAVEAAKAYVGLPPSLPNYDQLQGMGEDYLTNLAAQQMEAEGIPCPQDCQDLIKQGIHATYEQVKAGFSNSACMSDGAANQLGYEHGICLPDGVTSVPDPRGIYSDGVVTVQVQRKPGISDQDVPAFCSLGASAHAENDEWIGQQIGLWGPNHTNQDFFEWKGAHLSGLAIESQAPASIPRLADGQTISIPVPVSRVNFVWWLPGHAQSWTGFTPAPNEDDWPYLYHGAILTVTAGSACADPSDAVTVGPVVGPFDYPVQ